MTTPATPPPTLGDVVSVLDGWYPPTSADPWDAVGLVWGDPASPVRKVLFAVDPAAAVAEEASAWGADLLVVHHPLFLKPVSGVAATTAKGRTLATLAGAGCALLTAHTNADQAAYGVSESLALALGLTDLSPIRPTLSPPLDKLVVFVPATHAEALRGAVTAAGAGRIGDYDQATFTTPGEGRFRPLAGATPAVGEVGALEVVDEVRIETVVPRERRARVVRAMLDAHPYEEPAWDLLELADAGVADGGTGRIGSVEATTLGRFAETVATVLPATSGGVRVGGDPDRAVRRVAVCGGAGDFLLDELVTADVDVLVTSDLRHHPASEFLEKDGPALIDVSHWAAEWTWLPVVRQRMGDVLGDTVELRVSEIVTDPWRARIQSTSRSTR
jgi:dinuclear metal center YbgI/SA1388 family protein